MRAPALPSFLQLLTGFVFAACIYMLFLEPWGHDTWFHLQRLLDIRQQVSDGRLYAHFAENAAQGKGLPVWIYYSQWVYWPPMLLTFLGVSPLIALKLIYCLLLTVTCVGCYRLLRLQTDLDSAAFGTLLFMTSNYVIGEVFQRSAYAELLSVSLLPLLLVSLHQTLLHGDRRSGFTLVLLASLMILFHPLSFMNAGWAFLVYAAYVAIGVQIPYHRLLRPVPWFALALALTAFYWLPAVIETRYVLGAEGVPTPLRDTFLTIGRYLNFSGITNLGFVLTLVSPIVVACLVLRRRDQDASRAGASLTLLAGILIYLFLTLRISDPLYTHLPFLAANLWVWRVLFPMTLLTVILVTINLPLFPQRLRSPTALGALAGLAILQAAALVLWNTAFDLSLRPTEIRRIEEGLAEESQRLEGFGIDEYLPHPRRVPGVGAECHDVRSVPADGGYEMSVVVAASEADACVHVPRYWNTRYVASIDGEDRPVYANADGEIVIGPVGKAGVVTLRFARPTYVTLAIYLSGAAALVLIVSAALARRSPYAASPYSGRR